MKNKGVIVVAIILILTLLVSILPGRASVEAADSYMAIIPKVVHAGSTEELSLALFRGEELIPGGVEGAMLKEGEEILNVKEDINGKGTIEIKIPDIESGDYEIRVKGNGFEDKALRNCRQKGHILY